MQNFQASMSSLTETDVSSRNGETSICEFSLQKRKKYQLISDELRKEVVDKIIHQNLSIKQTSMVCNIKLSTCKAIYKIYQKEGRLEKKKHRVRTPKNKNAKNEQKLQKIHEFPPSSNSKILCSKISSKNSNLILAGDDQNTINLWDLEQELPQLSFTHQQTSSSINVEITSLMFDHNETMIISGSNRGVIAIYDIFQQKPKTTLKGHTISINSLSVFPSEDKSNLLVSGSSDYSLKLWDIRQKQCVNTWKGHSLPINALDCNFDGRFVASGAQDELIKIWDMNTWKQFHSLNLHQGSVANIKFHPNGHSLITSTTDKVVRFWGLEKFNLQFETKPDTTVINKLCFSEDGDHLFTASNDSLKVWDIKKQGLLLDNVESSWKSPLDIIHDKKQDRILGVSFQSGSFRVWSTEVKSINFTEDLHKRKSLSIYKTKMFDKENLLESANSRKNEGRKSVGEHSQNSGLKQKNLTINVNEGNLLQNSKLRSRTPKDFVIYERNRSKNKSPLIGKRTSSDFSASYYTPKNEQIKSKEVRTMNLGHLKERGVQHKIEEAPAECETSIMNMQKCCNEELKLSSFLMDKESNDNCQQFEIINELSTEHNKFCGIVSTRITYLKPIVTKMVSREFDSAIELIKSVKHYSLLIDCLQILKEMNCIEELKIKNCCDCIEKSHILLESRYEFHINFVINFLSKMLLCFIKTKNHNIPQEENENFLEKIKSIAGNSRFQKLTKNSKNTKIRDLASTLQNDIEALILSYPSNNFNR